MPQERIPSTFRQAAIARGLRPIAGGYCVEPAPTHSLRYLFNEFGSPQLQRNDNLLKYADLAGKGVEIAPYFNPAVPKRAGYDVVTIDVTNAGTLRESAREDPNVPDDRIAEIEPVDFVGEASRIGGILGAAGLAGKVAYIVSSHNFEHIPNPILFLRSCHAALAPGGVLSMAVPDCRSTFDHFRMPTRLADWLAAYHEDRRQPSPETLFDAASTKAMFVADGEPRLGCDMAVDDPAGFVPERDLEAAYEEYRRLKFEKGPANYRDAHCSVLFPEALHLMLLDLRRLGLIQLEIREISETSGFEFFVHLRKPERDEPLADDEYYRLRHNLMTRISENIGRGSFRHGKWKPEVCEPSSGAGRERSRFHAFLAKLIGGLQSMQKG